MEEGEGQAAIMPPAPGFFFVIRWPLERFYGGSLVFSAYLFLNPKFFPCRPARPVVFDPRAVLLQCSRFEGSVGSGTCGSSVSRKLLLMPAVSSRTNVIAFSASRIGYCSLYP